MNKNYLKRIIDSKVSLEKINKKHLTEITKESDDKWFLKVDGISDEVEILKNEIKNMLIKKETSEKFLYDEFKCEHKILIADATGRAYDYEDTCVLCGKKFYRSYYSLKGADKVAFQEKEFALFMGLEDITPPGFMADEEYITRYTIDDIRKLLINIINMHEGDEIDIVSEIGKLNLEHCIVNKPNKVNLILVIGGSNKEYIDKYSYLRSDNYINLHALIEKLNKLYKTQIDLVIDEESKYKFRDVLEKEFINTYTTLEGLEKELKYKEHAKYALIIDASSLFSYRVENDLVLKEAYDLLLKTKFKDVPIIKLYDFSKDKEEEMLKFLTEKEANSYACKYDSFYHLEQGKLKYTCAESTSSDIKKLIRKR